MLSLSHSLTHSLSVSVSVSVSLALSVSLSLSLQGFVDTWGAKDELRGLLEIEVVD